MTDRRGNRLRLPSHRRTYNTPDSVVNAYAPLARFVVASYVRQPVQHPGVSKCCRPVAGLEPLIFQCGLVVGLHFVVDWL